MLGEVKLREAEYIVVRENAKKKSAFFRIPDKTKKVCQISCLALHLYRSWWFYF